MPLVPLNPAHPGSSPGRPPAAPRVMPALGTVELARALASPASLPPGWRGPLSPAQAAWAAAWLAAQTSQLPEKG